MSCLKEGSLTQSRTHFRVNTRNRSSAQVARANQYTLGNAVIQTQIIEKFCRDSLSEINVILVVSFALFKDTYSSLL